jgi:pimeloyl-ACP methyl ester carboxylesterase
MGEIPGMVKTGLIVALGILGAAAEPRGALQVRIPLDPARQVEVAEVVARLAEATGLAIARPSVELALPATGLAGGLTRTLLAECLGPDARSIVYQGADLVVTLDPQLRDPDRIPQWEQRLRSLSARAEREVQRRARYGLRARNSYRPNDPGRPTVCLVHGLNSSSGGFVHMIGPLEEAGFGVVVYDYAFNRDLSESCARFRRDWSSFRREAGETRPWAIVAHSMGALVARSYVEDSQAYEHDVSALILIAPVNQGSNLAKAQIVWQLLQEVRAVKGPGENPGEKPRSGDALAHLGDGLGEAAQDMAPGSAFLRELNRRPRRAGVAYHILAGDVGFVSPAARRRIEDRVEQLRSQPGLLGSLARLATADLPAQLDEISQGSGDGCVAVVRTKLDGVADHVVVHANHAELIRAPLLYPDPGPVACMPYVLKWLGVGQPGPARDGAR